MTTTLQPGTGDELQRRANALRLHGLVAHWHELTEQQLSWLQSMLDGKNSNANTAACNDD